MKTKICANCNKEKLTTEFSQRSRTLDGLAYSCKECINTNAKQYRNKQIKLKEYLPENKICPKCGKRKLQAEFYFHINRADGLASWCKECMRKYNCKNNRNTKLRLNYNINEAQYELILKTQNGVCAICGQPETIERNGKILALAVDHIKGTYHVRGILCAKCNKGIGQFNHNPEPLEAAAKYLRES